MNANLRQLRYVLRHKYFVFREGWKIGVPVWNLVIHDLSKLSPMEWGAYRRKFFEKQRGVRGFVAAWQHHIAHNPHHWEHWLDEHHQPTRMPEDFVREMVADWRGASFAQRGYDNTAVWYEGQRAIIKLDPATRVMVEKLLPYSDAESGFCLVCGGDVGAEETLCAYCEASGLKPNLAV